MSKMSNLILILNSFLEIGHMRGLNITETISNIDKIWQRNEYVLGFKLSIFL